MILSGVPRTRTSPHGFTMTRLKTESEDNVFFISYSNTLSQGQVHVLSHRISGDVWGAESHYSRPWDKAFTYTHRKRQHPFQRSYVELRHLPRRFYLGCLFEMHPRAQCESFTLHINRGKPYYSLYHNCRNEMRVDGSKVLNCQFSQTCHEFLRGFAAYARHRT